MLIQVTLDSETPGDLERFFDLLTGFGGQKLAQNINEGLKVEPVVASEPDAPAPEQPKRHRRTKAEMEAAKVSEQAATQPAEQPAPSTATPAPPQTEQSKPISIDDLRAALQVFTSAKGMPAGIELLKKFGCSRVSELAAKDEATKAQFVAEAA